MPQMCPYNWLILFFLFNMIMILMSTNNFYMNMKKMSPKMFYCKMLKNPFKWKW